MAALPTSPQVTVAVPTRDRPDSLARCLQALERQTHPGLEVVVVDDGSRAAAAVRDVVSRAPRARLVRGAGRGPASARNLGVRAARAPVICFTDDDCEPRCDWVERLTAALAQGADAAAGITANARPDHPPAAASQAITDFVSRATLDRSGGLAFAPTSNLAARTSVLEAVPFDERYPGAAGEDRDWCARLRASGGRIVFAPDAVVAHHQTLSLGGFWRQQVRYGRGAQRFHRRHGRGLEPAGFYLRLLRHGFSHGLRAGSLVVVAQAATAWGRLLERVARQRPFDR